MINAIARSFNKLSKKKIFILGCFLVFLFGGIGLLTRHQIVFGVFYLLPVSIASWYGNRRQGIIVSILSVLMLLVDDIYSHHRPISSFLLYWDAFGRLLPFLIIAYVFPALRNALQQEREFSRTDPLTGIANTRAFYELAFRELERAQRDNYELTVSYMDIDNFKLINDSMGHAEGDALLREVAKIVHESIRTIDIVARIGGDEFVIMLPEAGYDESREIILRIHDNLIEQMKKNNWGVTFSIGAITYRSCSNSIDAMIKETDTIMYNVKSSGKNNVIHKMVE